MVKHGIKTLIVGHESSLNNETKMKNFFADTAIIGVTCVLHLISGGSKLQQADIPAQCVFLNYSGCKKNWTKYNMQTEINMNILDSIINKKKMTKKGDKNEYYSNIR